MKLDRQRSRLCYIECNFGKEEAVQRTQLFSEGKEFSGVLKLN